MTWKRYFVTALVLISVSHNSFATVPVTVDVLEVKKIWDKAPHNAFTDLVRWQDAFYCAFREGRGHVSTDGKIRILKSKDADHWESAALISLPGFDLRDAHLSITPDGKVFPPRLMLVGGAAPRKQDNQSAPTGTFVNFGNFFRGGTHWSKPQIVVEPGRWMWQVSWHIDKAYGVSYTAGKGSGRYLDLLVSDDGIHYTPHVPKLFEQGYPTEVTLRFDSEGTCYALVRRDRRGDDPSSAMLGISRPNYKQWQWKDLGPEFNGFGGPNFIQIPGGHWLAAGRMHDGGAHTALCYLDVENGKMTRLAKLPSGGDTSYPGMVWHNGILYISYYSSHEGKTSIYLAKIRVTTKSSPEGGNTEQAKAFLDIGEILKTWEDNYAHFKSMKVSYTERVLEAIPVAGHPNRLDNYVNKFLHVEKVEQGQRFHMRFSYDEEGFNKPGSIIEQSFDGEVSREYEGWIRSGIIGAGRIGRNTETMNHLKQYMCMTKKFVGLENPSGPFKQPCRYVIEDPNSKPELSRWIISALSESRVSVKPELESVAGQLCHVLEIYKKYTKGEISQKMWLAHERGMLLAKHQRYDHGILVYDFAVEQIDHVKTDHRVVWFPKMAYRMTDKEYLGKVKYEFVTDEFVPNIQVDADTFQFDFPKGTRINDMIRGIWGVDLPKEPPSLVGKALPTLEDLNVRLDADRLEDKVILICFWDMEQRPSRKCITQIAIRLDKLKQKGVMIVAVQASYIGKSTIDDWVEKNGISFPVGIIQDDEEKTRFSWGVESLPWLILTDRAHVVIAEGFGLDEMDNMIEEMNNVAL